MRPSPSVERVLTIFIWSLMTLVRWIPMTVAIWVARRIAAGVYWIDRRHRKIAHINLEIVFPGLPVTERNRLLRCSFENLGEHFVLVCKLPSLRTPDRMRQLIHHEGHEHYDKCKEEGRPVLFLASHVGFWELMAFSHGVLYQRVNFIVRRLNQKSLDKLLCHYRQLSGNGVIPKENAVRKIWRLLSNGEDVGILVDQNVQEKEGVFVNFFGKSACMTPSLSALALKSDAGIIPSYLVHNREGKARYRFYMEEEVVPVRTGNMEGDILATTQLLAESLESIIRRWPEYWLWGHRRWRTRPEEDQANPYAEI